MSAITVLNLATLERAVYLGITPLEAVICAYAQSMHDWNTWDYHKRYAHLVEIGSHTYLLGDWSSFHCSCHHL